MSECPNIEKIVQHLVETNYSKNITSIAVIVFTADGKLDILVANHDPDLLLMGALEMAKDHVKEHYAQQVKPFEPGCGNE